jgi:S1-C subfamily serine protease
MKSLFCLLLAFAVTARADEIANAGRAVLKKYREAVIGVKVVAKVAVPGRESTQEIKIDAVGIVVDAKGLTVASLRVVEPSDMLSQAARRDIQAEVTDLKLVLADRTEVGAALVLRDKDLDLAFLRPTEKLPKPAVVVPLSDDAAPEVLDNVVALGRSIRTPRLDPTLTDGRISAIVDKPRLFYVGTSALVNSGAGSAVFALDGKLIGQILLQRTLKGDTWPVIIPAADIAETAKQVPAAPAK